MRTVTEHKILGVALAVLVAFWVSTATAQTPSAPDPESDSVYKDATNKTTPDPAPSPSDETSAQAKNATKKADAAERPGTDDSAESNSADAATPSAPSSDEQTERLERAKRLFRQGNAMRRSGDDAAALSFYLRSRAALASVANTLNAAVCLKKLGRMDEALDLYEVLLTEFGAKLTDAERQSIAPEMAKLRSKVGSIDVTSNVAGTLVINSRRRGQLPLLRPVRVIPGEHRVAVLAEGYLTFQVEVSVKARQTSVVTAVLEPLAQRGTLRVDTPALTGAQVFVDGAAVGVVPWEGALAPGQHLFFLRRKNEGTAPIEITVVVNQIADAEGTLAPLGPEIELRASPNSAALTLDDVPLGKGRWRGRLPLGEHSLEAHENGYFPGTHRFELTRTQGVNVHLKLKTDQDHPRWGVSEPGLFWGDAVVGFASAPSLGSGAEAACDSGNCSNNESATGWLAGVRLGYELPVRIGLHLDGGYLALSKAVDRSYDSFFETGSGNVDTRYTLHDEIRLRGPYVGGGISYRLPLVEWFELHGDLLVGAFVATVSDPVEGNLTSADGTSAAVAVPGSEFDTKAVDLFVMPSVSARAQIEGFRAGIGLGVAFFALDGPVRTATGTGALLTDSKECQPSVPSHAACAPATNIITAEKGYGSFAMWLPHLILGYAY